MNHVEVWEKFLELESRHSLCALTIGGLPLWDYLRFFVYMRIVEQSTAQANPPHGAPREKRFEGLTRRLRVMKHSVTHNPLHARRFDYLFISAGNLRRTRSANGSYVDQYSDPVIAHLGREKCLLLEDFDSVRGAHHAPVETRHVVYSEVFDLYRFLSRTKNRLLRKDEEQQSISASDQAILAGIEQSLGQQFAVNIDLRSMLEAQSDQQALKAFFGKVLQQVAPKAVFIVCSYGKEGYIAACKERGIPVIELQHGIVSKYHVGYSYPNGGGKTLFPDYFFSFGKYWTENIRLPIPPVRCYSIGLPQLSAGKALHAEVKKGAQILFLSQSPIGEKLSRFAIGLRAILPSNWRIVYKLHPTEEKDWYGRYPWLAVDGIAVVADAGTSLYRLMAESPIQVGVYSTAIFEGLAFGCKTYIVDLPGVEHMQGLIDKGYAKLVAAPQEIAIDGAFAAGPERGDIFAENWQANLDSALGQCLRAS